MNSSSLKPENGSVGRSGVAAVSKYLLQLELGFGLVLFGLTMACHWSFCARNTNTSANFSSHATVHLEEGERVCIVGDVHGCLEELKDLLCEVYAQYSPDIKVVLVGDLVNKGPFSADVVKFIRSKPDQFFSVKGNHDHAAAKRFGKSIETEQNGTNTYSWIHELSDEDKQWLETLPYTISIPALNCIVVHAGLIPNKSLQEQKPTDLMLMRNVSVDNETGEFKSEQSADRGFAWAEVWSNQKKKKVKKKQDIPHVYFGHDARRGLQHTESATGLDTGCCYGRKLTCCVLPDRTFLQVKAKEVYEVRDED